jgi:hypothetical protein
LGPTCRICCPSSPDDRLRSREGSRLPRRTYIGRCYDHSCPTVLVPRYHSLQPRSRHLDPEECSTHGFPVIYTKTISSVSANDELSSEGSNVATYRKVIKSKSIDESSFTYWYRILWFVNHERNASSVTYRNDDHPL